MNNLHACIYVCEYDSDDDGFITGHYAKFLSYLMCDFYKKEIQMESFIHEIYEQSDLANIKIRFIHQSTMSVILNLWNLNRKSMIYGFMFSTKNNSESYILLLICASFHVLFYYSTKNSKSYSLFPLSFAYICIFVVT